MFLIYSLSTLLLAYPLFHMVSRKLKISSLTFNIFFIIKFTYLLLYIYAHYDNFGTDSIGYFNNSHKFNFQRFPISENLIYGINYFFKNYFYFNFESLNILTFFLSFSSSILLLSLIKDIDNPKKLGLSILLLFPSLNYFTSGLNKDMLVFFGLSLFLFSLFKKKNFLLILSIFLVFLVRPYVCFAILTATLIVNSSFFLKRLIINKNISLGYFSIYFISVTISLIIIYYISDSLLGSFGKYFLKGNINQIVINLQSHYADTPLGIPIDKPIFLRIIDYIFFPSFWHITDTNLFFIILKFENMLLIFIIIICFYYSEFLKIKNFQIFLALLSFLILFLILVVVTSNHGIAIRQKWMILPFILIIISRKRE